MTEESTFSALDEYVTVIVTPKLCFQLPKRPEWRFVEDITQDELRRGFLSRFPPALWLSSSKFSFRSALPPTSLITSDTMSLVFKLVSDEVPDERVLLSILRELEKSYEAIIRRAVSETRSEALHEQLTLKEQTETFKREQEKKIVELKKENSSFRDQSKSMQKRLFLVEQENDQLRKDQQGLRLHVVRLENMQIEQAEEFRSQQSNFRSELDMLRDHVGLRVDANKNKAAEENVVTSSVLATVAPSVNATSQIETSSLPAPLERKPKLQTSSTRSTPRREGIPVEINRVPQTTGGRSTASRGGKGNRSSGVKVPIVVPEFDVAFGTIGQCLNDDGLLPTGYIGEVETGDASRAALDGKEADSSCQDGSQIIFASCGSQTNLPPRSAAYTKCGDRLQLQVDQLQMQLTGLQGWLLQGSRLLTPLAPMAPFEALPG